LVVKGELESQLGASYSVKMKEITVSPTSETRVGAKSTVVGYVLVSAVEIVKKDGTEGLLVRQ
jgi:hypothetical protein